MSKQYFHLYFGYDGFSRPLPIRLNRVLEYTPLRGEMIGSFPLTSLLQGSFISHHFQHILFKSSPNPESNPKVPTMKTLYLLISTIFGLSAQSSNIQQPIPTGDDISTQISPVDLDSTISSSPLLSFHKALVEIPSISNHEKNIGDFILYFLSEHNFTTEKQIVCPATGNQEERFNIYAYTGENPHVDILLTSHIDTVPPYIPYTLHAPTNTNSAQPLEFNRSALQITGRGTVDAKASVAAQVFAVLETLKFHPTASLGLLFTVGEENSGAGMKFFSNSSLNTTPPLFRSIIFGEPTDAKLVSAHKGTLSLRVIANGKTAHSGYPWLGASAVSALLPVLSELDDLQNRTLEQGGLTRSEVLGNSTLNIGVVNGGVARNVVPDFAEAGIVIRLAGGSVADTKGIIERAVERISEEQRKRAGGGEARIELRFEGGSEPQFFDTLEGFEVTTVNYGTDAFSLKIGDRDGGRVKRFLYGPGRFSVAHSIGEGISVGEIEEGVRGFRRIIEAAL